LQLRRFSTLNNLLLAHSPYPTTDADAVFFGPDTYRFCKLISDTIKKAVDIG
jgi:release factor glutamine methyltransferase